jgi:serine/threonine-protein kinase
MSDLIGKTLGQYEIKSLLGKGGMALVYRATQTSMGRDVAIKIMASDLSGDPEFVGRFEREAQIFSDLQHPHILPVIDYGNTGEGVYIVMRLVEGGGLDTHIRNAPVEPPIAAKMLTQKGIVHRDLKASNVLLDEGFNAYLTDFGIAKMLANTSKLTATDTVLGTPSYMAPEQWRGDHIDARTDIYSMGIMAFEMVTGKLPFEGDTSFTLMYKHINDAPPRPRELMEHLSDDLEYVILRAMSKAPEDRFQSAEEMGEAFRNAVEGRPIEIKPTFLHDPDAAPTMVGYMEDSATLAQDLTPSQARTMGITPSEQLTAAPPIAGTGQQARAGGRGWLWGVLGAIVLVGVVVGGLFASGTIGEVASSSTETPTPTETFTPTNTATASPTATDTVTATATNTPSTAEVSVLAQRSVVRSGPGEQYPEIGVLERGTQTQVVAVTTEGDWYRVLVGGELGWVQAETVSVSGNESVIEVVEIPTATPTDTPTSIPTDTPTPTATETATLVPTLTPSQTRMPDDDATEVAAAPVGDPLQTLTLDSGTVLTPISLDVYGLQSLLPERWPDAVPIGNFFYFSQTGEFNVPVLSVLRGTPTDIDDAFGFVFADPQSPSATLRNIAEIEADPSFTVVAMDGFAVPASRMSGVSVDGQSRLDYFIIDLAADAPGTDWLSIFSIHPADSRYQRYVDEIVRYFVQSLHIDGNSLGTSSGSDVVDVPSGERVLTMGARQQDFLNQRQVHEWRFELTEGDLVRIFLNGLEDDLDPVLELQDLNGNELAFDDDSGGGLNALIRFQAPVTGTYIVRASFFSFDDAGAYEIGIEPLDARAINGGELTSGMTVRGQITDDAIETLYTFEAQPGGRVTVSIESLFGDLDTTLALLGPNGSMVAENDDHNSDEIELFFATDSAMVNIPIDAAGTYTIIAGRYQGQLGSSTGEFELSLTIQ